ncbi:MAG TPA: hypothetical protein VHV55_05715 [Pirellulales bacterium]|jgi:hypothetical protein|nr:hypothetical protein [Pirellulales bacterium]
MATAGAAVDPEAVFLEGQACEARDRLSHSLAALPQNLGRALCPLAWTARFPWAATGAVALGAFGLALAIDRRLNRTADPRSTVQIRPRVARPRRARRFVSGAMRRWVIRPLQAALYARLYGLL